MSADAGLLVEVRDGVKTLTINRPHAHNALNAPVIASLRAEVLAAADDTAIRVVVIAATGGKAFSAGADLKELAGMTADEAHATMRAGQQAFRDIERAAVPVIAAVDGLALGGGFELALCATFPVLTTRASLGLPETSLGLIPGYGGTQRLPAAVGPRVAAHLMLTGSRLDADRAYALGLTPVAPVPPEALDEVVAGVAATLGRQGPQAVRSVLTALESGRDAALDTGLHLETGLAALAVASSESSEGIAAFLERRPARFAAPSPEEQR